MKRARVIKEPLNGMGVGTEFDCPVSKFEFWSERGMVEEVKPKPKATKAAPKDKVVRGSTDK